MRKSQSKGKSLMWPMLIGVIGLAFIIGSGTPAWADVEDVLFEKGTITKEEWVKIKADKEKINQAAKGQLEEYRVSEVSRAQGLAAMKGVEIGVVVYFNATYATGTSETANPTKGVSNATANNNKGQASGFHFSRTYLNVRKYFENGDHIRLTLDQMVNDVGGASCPNTNNTGTAGKCNEAAPFGLSGFGGTGRNNTFVKYAYYEHVFMPGVQLRTGLHQTPWIEYEESRWTYRYLFPTMVDQQNFQTSSDMGVSLLGKVWNDMIDYHVSFQEGEGYQNAPDARGFALLGRVSVEPYKADRLGVIVSAFGHNERERSGIEGFNPQRWLGNVEVYDPSKDTFKIDGQIVWADDGADVGQKGFGPGGTKFNVPGTYNTGFADNSAVTYGGVAGPSTSIPRFHQARGYEAWAWYRIPSFEKIRLHGRYYFMKPNKDTPAGDTQSYYFGVSYDYSKFLAFSLDYTILQQTVLGSATGVGNQAITTSGACAVCATYVNYNNQILGLRALITF